MEMVLCLRVLFLSGSLSSVVEILIWMTVNVLVGFSSLLMTKSRVCLNIVQITGHRTTQKHTSYFIYECCKAFEKMCLHESLHSLGASQFDRKHLKD